MTVDATQVRAMLDAWREQGAARLDPVRFHRLDALERRAAALDGDARALLDARLAALADEYAQLVARTPAPPLNSNSLVHRSLSTMRELSPAYLQQFLSYVDALACLEDLVGAGAQPDKDAARTKAAKPAKPAKKGTRTRAR